MFFDQPLVMLCLRMQLVDMVTLIKSGSTSPI